MSPWLARRAALDRILAGALLVVLCPLAVAAAIATRLDGGPALIRVTRVGCSGRPFAMLKIRSMRSSAPGGLAAGPALTGLGDPRVTRVGAVLRKSRLDETPQLLNVVRGEMALVGPRPEDPEFVDVTDDRWQRVLRSRPGIAGLSQVLLHRWELQQIGLDAGDDRYRRVVLPVKLAVDLFYVEHASPALDLRVAIAAMGSLFGRDAARLRQAVGRRVPELVDLES